MRRNTKNVPEGSSTLTIAGCAIFFCAIFAVAVAEIHPAPDKVTRQKDAAELAIIEAHSPVASTKLGDSPPATASNSGIDRNPAHFQAKTREARLVDGRTRPISQKNDSVSREAKRQLKAWKDYQREQAIATWRQRYAEQGSFFKTLGRALGFSTQQAEP
jgi:hypothetical protein